MRAATRILFIFILAEIALGGGGRITSWGPMTLRMILFAISLIYSSVYLFRGEKIPKDYKILLFSFASLIIIGLGTGIINGAQPQDWWEDIKPLLYFLITPFFVFAIRDATVVGKAASVLKTSALLLASGFLLLLFLIHTKILPFLQFHQLTWPTGEFFFRGEITFFYKGFLYLCIGFIFFHLTFSRYKVPLMTFLLLAIIFSATRGFLFALAMTYSVYFFQKGRWLKLLVVVFIASVILFFGQLAMAYISQRIDAIATNNSNSVPANSTLLGDRKFSDSMRKQQLLEVAERVTPASFFIGHGFGIGIPARPVHMEISYLEIFHKQGLIGIAFWAYILLLLLQKARKASDTPVKHAMFYSALFVFFQSLTNQYINNPIGLCMILLALVSIDVLGKPKLHFQTSLQTDNE